MEVIKNEVLRYKRNNTFPIILYLRKCMSTTIVEGKKYGIRENKISSIKDTMNNNIIKSKIKNDSYFKEENTNITVSNNIIKSKNKMAQYKYGNINFLLKNAEYNAYKDKQVLNDVIETIFENTVIINNMNFVNFNMILTFVNKYSLKIKKKKILHDILFLLHKYIDIRNDVINNNNSSWVNIINAVVGISKNNSYLLYLIRNHYNNKEYMNGNNNMYKNNILNIYKNENINSRHSFINKFIHRIMSTKNYNYSIREISLLFHAFSKLNIKNEKMFSYFYELMLDKDFNKLNCLDIHLFLHSIYKLQLNYSNAFVQKIKEQVLKNLHDFSSGQLVNILLSYSYFFKKQAEGNKKINDIEKVEKNNITNNNNKKNKNKNENNINNNNNNNNNNYMIDNKSISYSFKENTINSNDILLHNIFNKCLLNLNSFPNREFCNFLNFIIQNKININEKQKNIILKNIISLLQNKHNMLKLQLMIDLDIFTVINFIFKYNNTNDSINILNHFSYINLEDHIINLIKKNKFKQDLLIYILHFYKNKNFKFYAQDRIHTNQYDILFFLQNITINKLNIKMKIILLTSMEWHNNTTEKIKDIEQYKVKHISQYNDYYYKLLKCLYDDIYNILSTNHLMCEETSMDNNNAELNIYEKKKNDSVTFTYLDMKEVLKLLKIKNDNNEENNKNHKICINTYNHYSLNSYDKKAYENEFIYQNDIKKVENNLFHILQEYIIDKEIIELFYIIIMNKNVYPDFINKSEIIMNKYFETLNKDIIQNCNNYNNNIRNEKKLSYNFIHTLNMCNENMFIKRNNISNFLNNKNILLKWLNNFMTYHLEDTKENNMSLYFNLYVHMLLFDINNNINNFLNNIFDKICNFLKDDKLQFHNNLINIIDIYSSIIKLDNGQYDIYIKNIYYYTFLKVFQYYKQLNIKYMSLLYYSNIIQLYVHIYQPQYYNYQVSLSLRLLKELFYLFINSLDKSTYNSILTHFNEIQKYKIYNNNSLCKSSLLTLNDIIYIYRSMTIFHFLNIYKYMTFKELKTFYNFYNILKFIIFNVNNFDINDFTQTHKGVSFVHNSVLYFLKYFLKDTKKYNIMCEKVVFPLCIIDILIEAT
ncbi:conserved Plasmodium protein, unknown function [Plasmodium sp. DRC-Itaito]|uniref:Heptatricopeptide repeat-containing protein n=1 Tax=Plasmodium gaboni TaxID=647221 RepID=A0ABY1UK03_9APIC|nr:conserved Plasmodium protein, unknown function [Plasmodium gaboni]SOV21436.1 conserved Plasmodium protein, unknown function [Plasmodium sp. DRC-Itaito]